MRRRQRERTFRLFDEGSGAPIDTDIYDEYYVHLFVWDRKNQALLGAYRMGRTDQLRKLGKVYLSQMFNFEDAFYEECVASLELGRSFVTPEYQKSHYSLHLLWRGIGAYLRLHPEYDRLYGTVSLSRQYDLRSICVMCDSLIAPTHLISPKNSLDTDLGPEWREYKKREGTLELERISMIVRNLEKGRQNLPVLLRHYHKVGARFLSAGVDQNFNNTPGLLLSVDIRNLPDQKRKRYVDGG
jgi:putative hemolysin